MGTIDDYLATLDADDAAAITRVYDLARAEEPSAEQGIGYGMPALTYRGKALLSVMRAKAHFGVYPFSPAAIVRALPLLGGVDRAKGTVRFRPGQPLPDAAVRALVAARRDQIDDQVGSRH
ncbi:iron chaperone [Microbacterium sp.]|uniref:iron chaperone n=1 Tax=Microbacterium sp. TaxID=51671 RepID=UPI003A8791F8